MWKFRPSGNGRRGLWHVVHRARLFLEAGAIEVLAGNRSIQSQGSRAPIGTDAGGKRQEQGMYCPPLF